ncbi:Ig-like domain-containing protein [Paenibacillus sp. sptzw28]|uniref:LamG-like jellyroll fold domain-containing protein n=1 Tax=Paenibacillus sp. sptzw28 TaxID=715179 RepID=UPI001C6E21E6|nr:LamG-like jellyroll fold domain-containing protein [Paenibacillus sp. sptzw28]QYR21525.1 Ig-like domain-containing protein [Paenibacillus sp. sptzw28]
MRKLCSIFNCVILTLTLVLPAAASAEAVTEKEKNVPAALVRLDKTDLALAVGQSDTLTANITPPVATDKSVQWSSSDPAVAAVDGSGVVTAAANGTAVITATSASNPKASDSATVTVYTVPVGQVTLDKSEINLVAGYKETLSATVLPDNATHKNLVWTSTHPEIAAVDANGVVTAHKQGTAVITAASVSNPDKTASATVTVSWGFTVPPEFQNASVHDPSVILVGDTYYVFGSHLAAAKSKDLINWTRFAEGVNADNPLFDNVLEELKEAFEWSTVQGLWAADVIQLPDGKFYMYYNSCQGTSPLSAMGVAVADNIEGPYVNKGIFVTSGKGKARDGITNYNAVIHPNAVDPDVFFDKEGKLWMVYGSYSGGIFILEMDPNTGLPLQNSLLNMENNGYGRKLTGGYHTRIEAPYIQYVPATDDYFLYVTFGGLDSVGGYNMRIARADNPAGPYYDAEGNNMINATASPGAQAFDDKAIEPYGVKQMGNFLFSNLDAAQNYPTYGYVSAGHNSTYYDKSSGKWFNIFHSRFPFRGEAHEIRVHQLFMNENGWPVLAPHRYAGETIAPVTEQDVVGGYHYINHGKSITKDITRSVFVELNPDHTIGGSVSGTWELRGEHFARLNVNGEVYDGVFARLWDPTTSDVVITFSAISSKGVAVMGSQLAPLSDKQAVANTYNSLTLGDTSRVYGNIALPTQGARNAVVTWASSNPAVVTETGAVTRPSESEGDKAVELTATITMGSETASKVFTVIVKAVPSDPLADGLTAHYRFDDSLSEATGQQNEGTVTGSKIDNTGGSITYSTGALGHAAVFDGASGVRLPDGLIKGDVYSVSMWLNPKTLTSFATTFFGAASTDSWVSLVPQSWDSNLMLWSGTAWYDGITNTKMQTNAWAHVVFTVDKGNLKVYVNGVQKFTGSNFPNVFTNADGVFGLGVNFWDAPFNGSMDDLRVYEIALSADKVSRLYNVDPDPGVLVEQIAVGFAEKQIAVGTKFTPQVAVLPLNAGNKALEWSSANPAIAAVDPVTGQVTGVSIGTTTIKALAKDGSNASASYTVVVTGGLVAHYAFESNLADSTGQRTAGTVTGNRINNTGGIITYAAGKSGKAAVFNGLSGVRLPDGLISGNVYTVSMWLNPTALTEFTTTFFGARTTDSWISFLPKGHGFVNNDTMLWSGTAWYDAGTGMKMKAGEWAHAAFTVDNGNVKIYINGVLKFTGTGFPNVFTNSSGVFGLGVNYWDIPYNGLMDELRVYNMALSGAQVAELAK